MLLEKILESLRQQGDQTSLHGGHSTYSCENNVKAHLKKINSSFHSFRIYSLLDMAAINIIMDSHFTMDFLESQIDSFA